MVQVFGRLKDSRGNVIFTCSASGRNFEIAAAECLRLSKSIKTPSTSGCGCSKQVNKMIMCQCCDTRLATSCNGESTVII